jgi:hypothetical protein
VIVSCARDVTFEVLPDGRGYAFEPNAQSGFKEVAAPRMIVDLGRYAVDDVDYAELTRRVEAAQRIMEQGE